MIGRLTVATHDRGPDPACLACRDTRLGPDHQPCAQCADDLPPDAADAARGGSPDAVGVGGQSEEPEPTTALPTGPNAALWLACFAEAAADELSPDQFARLARQATVRADARMQAGE